LTILLCAAAALAQEKPKPGPELTPEESRQADRLGDLYAEVSQQLVEAQARVKVLAEMQQKLLTDFAAFQSAVLAARGYKPGEALLDLASKRVKEKKN
jgi:hypothetical protein